MRHTELPSECDAVVIGAGIGGLTSAAMLAKAGLRVCVLEAEQRPGGYLAGFNRGAFRFDTAIHWLNQCGPKGYVRRVFDFLGPGAPGTRPQTRIRRYKSASFDYLLTNDPNVLRDTWIREYPHDRQGVIDFFEAAHNVGRALDSFTELARLPSMNFSEKLRTHLKIGATGITFLRYLGKSAERTLANYFQEEKLRRVFASEESLISILAPIGWAYMNDFQMPPVGGSQSFPMWLCQYIEACGGHIALSCRVKNILVENKKAVGVLMERGRHRLTEDTLRTKYVVAASDLSTLFEKMLPKEIVKKSWGEKVSNADLYQSSVTVSVALNVPSQELGFDEELISLTRDDVTREQQNSGDPEKSGMSVLAPSLRDPTLAPAGKGTLTIYAPARMDYGDYWKTEPGLVRGRAYKDFKQAYADILIERVEKAVAPGLRKHMEFCDIATPITHQRYTGNRNGTIMAQTPTGKNIRDRVARYKTPLENLFVGGHWAEYGGGVPIAVRAGVNSAMMVLERERPVARKTFAQALDKITTPTTKND